MRKDREFIARLQALLEKSMGQTAGKGLLKNQMARLNKDLGALTDGDCNLLIRNIVEAVSRFTTREEAARVQDELDRLFKRHFSR